jgi:hypothetical protein
VGCVRCALSSSGAAAAGGWQAGLLRVVVVVHIGTGGVKLGRRLAALGLAARVAGGAAGHAGVARDPQQVLACAAPFPPP